MARVDGEVRVPMCFAILPAPPPLPWPFKCRLCGLLESHRTYVSKSLAMLLVRT